MRVGSNFLRGVLLAAVVAILPSCTSAGFPQFGGSGCRTVYVLSGGIVQPVNTCGGVPREGLVAQKAAPLAAPVAGSDLPALLAAPKFEPDAYYAGVDTPKDKARLTTIVNDAVRDLIDMPSPRDQIPVRLRLELAVQQLGAFATEDREHGYIYIALAWRAAGLSRESGLFSVPDEQVLDVP